MYNSVTKQEVFVLLDLQVCSRYSSGTKFSLLIRQDLS